MQFAGRKVFALLVVSGLAAAQEYPTRPIRIVTGEIGGAPDIISRLMGPALTARLGKPIVVDNRGGGNGAIAAQAVARAAPDGHTLLFYAGALWLAPLMNGVQEDPLKDFAPVSLVASSPNIVVVHPSLPVKSIGELIALAKARPRALNYASSGLGSSPHLAGELFNSMAGVQIVRIAYKGGGPAINDLVSRIRGEIHQAVQRADIRERLLHNGIEPAGSTPEELAALLKTEIARWGQFFKTRNIRAE